MRNTVLRAALVSAAAITILAGTAQADPPSTHTLALTDLAGVGDQTTQYAMNDITTGPGGYDATQNPTHYIDSFDEVNPLNSQLGDQITTKPGCTITRPAGGGYGINALVYGQQSTVDGKTYCIDYVRSSRVRLASDPSNVGFLPFAQDTVKYATSYPTTSFPSAPFTNAPQNLTRANLTNIYSCGLTGHSTTHWNDFGGTSADAVQALIPISGSDTRTFFEQSIGVTDTTIQAGVNAGCIQQVMDNDPIPVRSNADRIAPFSVAQFNTVSKDAGIQLNSSGYSQNRVVYNVVRLNASGYMADPNLVPLFGDDGVTSTGWICSPTAQSIIDSKDGFTPITLLGHTCGIWE